MQKLAVLVSERFNGQITQRIYLRSYKYICALLVSMFPSQNANGSPNGRSNDEASPFTSLNLICLKCFTKESTKRPRWYCWWWCYLAHLFFLIKKAEEIKIY